MTATNAKGITFTVVSFGTGREAKIAFYDTRFTERPHWKPHGQFVASYYARTLAEHREGAGLLLQGDSQDWRLEWEPLRPVIELARTLTNQPH